MSYTQLEGNIRAGITPATAVDISEEVTRFLVTEQMTQVERRRSFAAAGATQEKSGINGSLGIDFDTDNGAAVKFRALARTAMYDDATATDGRRPGEIWVAGTESTDAISSTNQLCAGWALVTDLDIFGGTPGEVRAQSKTWTLREITFHDTDPAPLDEGS
jgi:hypothetical protein